ncbi:MAG: aminotransferase class IV [Thermoplasmata archaeon]
MSRRDRPAVGAPRPGPTGLPPGLRMGDGVFETVRTYGGEPFELRRHLARLGRGARALGLPLDLPIAKLERAGRAALAERRAEGSSGEWVLRIFAYASGEGASLALDVTPLVGSPGAVPGRSRVVGVSSYPHPGPYLVPPGAKAPVKWIARGPLAHALREATRRGWDEALLADSKGRFVEGTRSNLLALIDGRLVSPGGESFALPGVTRARALREARRAGIEIAERPIEAAELGSATELFLASTLLGIVAVDRVVGRWRRPPGTGETILPVLRRALPDSENPRARR